MAVANLKVKVAHKTLRSLADVHGGNYVRLGAYLGRGIDPSRSTLRKWLEDHNLGTPYTLLCFGDSVCPYDVPVVLSKKMATYVVLNHKRVDFKGLHILESSEDHVLAEVITGRQYICLMKNERR